VLRVSGDAYAEPIIVTARDHRFTVGQQLKETGCSGTIILEPEDRGSGPAVAAAAAWLLARAPDALMLVTAPDCGIGDSVAFNRAVAESVAFAQTGSVLVFALTPHHAATGHGYIKPGKPLDTAVREVGSFLENPDSRQAQSCLDDGYLRSAGSFLCRASTILEEYRKFEPETAKAVNDAVERATKDPDFLALDPASYSRAAAQSIEHAVLARTGVIAVRPVHGARSVEAAAGQDGSSHGAPARCRGRVERPWGWYETLALAEGYQVKRIVIHPGGRLSLQKHLHRHEHWVVVRGSAVATIDDETRLIAEGESVYVPLGSVHRLENQGKTDLEIVEIQTGSYLGEDDIVRLDDAYGREGI
jgi:mannose-1-phosphate guanylyltransferase/mannose-6-phosphate isomerase